MRRNMGLRYHVPERTSLFGQSSSVYIYIYIRIIDTIINLL